jgi:hypothetical protein
MLRSGTPGIMPSASQRSVIFFAKAAVAQDAKAAR